MRRGTSVSAGVYIYIYAKWERLANLIASSSNGSVNATPDPPAKSTAASARARRGGALQGPLIRTGRVAPEGELEEAKCARRLVVPSRMRRMKIRLEAVESDPEAGSSMVAMVKGWEANGEPPSVGNERNALWPAVQCSARRRGTAMRKKCGERRVRVAFGTSSAFVFASALVVMREKAAKRAEGGL